MNRLARLLSALLLIGCGLGTLPAQAQIVVPIGSGIPGANYVAIDGSGNVYVSYFFRGTIAEILATGGYSTVVTLPTGFSSPQAIALDSSSDIFAAEPTNGALLESLAAGGYTTTNSLLGGVNAQGVAVDGSGNVFFTDGQNNAVKEILAVGGYTTVNTLVSGLNAPRGVAVDGSGNVFFADSHNNAVKEILAAGGYGTVITLAVTTGNFNQPQGVAVDGSGNVFVVDGGTSAVKEILAAGDYVTVTTLASGLADPEGVAVDGNGDVFVADAGDGTVQEILAVPAVGAVTPSAGPAAGGNTVTIAGTGLAGATAIAFGTVPATSFTVVSPTRIAATVPAGTIGTVDVTVTAPGGTSATGVADDYTYAPAPVVSAIAPTGGPTAGGTAVIITATDLTGTTAVSFGTVAAASFSIDSATQIAATAPPGAAGTVDVTVTALGGISATTAADQFTYVAPPTVSSVGPSEGPVSGGNSVTITGTNLTGATSVRFGAAAAASFTVNSATRITATVPAGSAGSVDVTVTTLGGVSVTSVADGYTYVAAPSVSAITPASGPAAGDTVVTITGTNLTDATAVQFGTTAATFLINSATQITATTPAGAAGIVDVTVTNSGGISATGAADRFTYIAAGTVTTVSSVSPASGATSGGNLVTITGGNLTGATAVKFGTVAATSFSVGSATQITAAVPAGSAGSVDVTVTTPDGTSATSVADGYTYVAAPTVIAITPTAGPTTGSTAVTLTGTNLTGATMVKFGTVAAASFSVDSATQITAKAPAGAASVVDVTVTTSGGTSTTGVGDRYTYTAAPIVNAVSPANGAISGGASVTITGSNLTGATSVKFGAMAASFSVDSDAQIIATAPAGASGAVDVTVTTPDGTSATGAGDRYTYTSAPIVSAISPTSGAAAGGTVVTITGVNFTGATALKFGTAAASFSVASATQISATAPAGSAGTVDVTVTVPTGTSVPSAADRFTYTTGIAGQAYAYQSTLGVAGVAKADDAHFSGPAAGAVDTANSHLFIADTGNHRVQVLDTGSLAVVATIGTAGVASSDNAHLDAPQSVGFDPATGHILVADSGNDRIQIFDAKSFGYLATLGTSGNAGPDNAHFNQPAAVHLNPASRELDIADTGNDRVQVFDADTLGYIATLGTSGVPGSDNAHFNQPKDAEFNPSANQIMVADGGNGRLQLFDAGSLAYTATIGGLGLGTADNDYLGSPGTAAFDPVSNLVLVADTGADARIQVFDAMTYGYVLTLGTTGSGGAGNSQFAGPAGIASDPAHARIFIGDRLNDRIQVYSIGPAINFASVLPGSRSVLLGTPATIFASMINAGTTPLGGCQVALPVTAPDGLTLSYQTTNPATNALTGTPNTPATIAPNDGVQSFLVSLQGATPFVAAALPLDFDCSGVAPAAVVTGVDTIDLTLSATPIADIIALAATPTNNGIVEIPIGGAAAFAVASSNVGAASLIIASVDTGNATLPLSAVICQSNPGTGQCLATPAASVPLSFAAGATPTFSVFVQASGPIPLDPATARIFVRFKDADGALHGSTSVAVATD